MTSSSVRRRTALLAVALLLVAAVPAAWLLYRAGRPAPPVTRSADADTTTVRIVRTTLVRSATVQGQMNYGSPLPVVSKATGTVTWLPAVGSTLRRGETLLRVDDRPVVLLLGSIPMYRALHQGLTGRDVQQFESNLRQIGYTGFDVDEEYSDHTVAAVKRWQAALGLQPTGVVGIGDVVYVTHPLRVAGRSLLLGAPATGEVITGTGTQRLVVADVPTTSAAWAVPGRKVTVTTPAGKRVAGTVSSIGANADPVSSGDQSGSGSGGSGSSDGTAVAATVQVVVRVRAQAALGRFQQSPVDVGYDLERRPHVLAVPVAALLAPSGGGYAVEVVGPSGDRLVAVRTGLFAGGLVEVDSPGLAAGSLVRIPR